MRQPLADKIRPSSILEFNGQEHLLGKGKPIRLMIDSGHITSCVLWGPPGCGKTSLARLIATAVEAEFVQLSAISATVSDIRKVLADATNADLLYRKHTILFIDEIHRFNKSQQDALLPPVEQGLITFIGATTENPGFEINAPLLSRSHVYRLHKLSEADLNKVLEKGISQFPGVEFTTEAKSCLLQMSGGDARSLLNMIELAAGLGNKITKKSVEAVLQEKLPTYDKKGDNHYDTISAFIKSMRASDPDATVYYLAVMISAGEDPMFIARSMVIFAAEDIGNAQPTALVLATAAMQAVHMIGYPEAQLVLSQAATYLATAKKSIASTVAISEALAAVKANPGLTSPLHLRNAPNTVMKGAGFSKGHIRYPWLEEKNNRKPDVLDYLPEELRTKKFYRFQELTEVKEK